MAFWTPTRTMIPMSINPNREICDSSAEAKALLFYRAVPQSMEPAVPATASCHAETLLVAGAQYGLTVTTRAGIKRTRDAYTPDVEYYEGDGKVIVECKSKAIDSGDASVDDALDCMEVLVETEASISKAVFIYSGGWSNGERVPGEIDVYDDITRDWIDAGIYKCPDCGAVHTSPVEGNHMCPCCGSSSSKQILVTEDPNDYDDVKDILSRLSNPLADNFRREIGGAYDRAWRSDPFDEHRDALAEYGPIPLLRWEDDGRPVRRDSRGHGSDYMTTFSLMLEGSWTGGHKVQYKPAAQYSVRPEAAVKAGTSRDDLTVIVDFGEVPPEQSPVAFLMTEFVDAPCEVVGAVYRTQEGTWIYEGADTGWVPARIKRCSKHGGPRAYYYPAGGDDSCPWCA